jgi:hypothetical protein
MKKILLAVFAVCVGSWAHAATIYVAATADDPVGQSFVYQLRENIAASHIHRLADTESDGAFTIQVVTLDPQKEGNQTIYSITLTMRDFTQNHGLSYFITNWVGVCGQTVVAGCAKNLTAAIDGAIQPIAAMLMDAAKKQPEPKR